MKRPAAGRTALPQRTYLPQAHAMASTDRLLGGTRIGVGLGPLDLPSRSDLADAFVRIASRGPAVRLGLTLAEDGQWRERGVRIADRCDEVFRVAPESVRDPRTWLRDHWVPDLPVQFALAGDRLGMVMDHRLGDGGLSSILPLALIEVARGRPVPPAFDNLTERPLGAALAAAFGRRPGAWLAVADDIRRHRAVREAPAADATVRRLSVPSGCHLTATVGPDQLARLRTWCRGRIAVGPALALAAGQAMRTAGLSVSSRGELVVDLRRYLPAGTNTLGNFIAGLELPLSGRDAAPELVHQRMNRALAVGRPLATAAIGALPARVRVGRRPTGAPAPLPARISMSSLGRLRAFEKLPWTVPPEQRWAEAHTEPGASGTLGFIAIVMDGRLNLHLTWRGEEYDPATVAGGADLLAADPVALLEALAGGR